MKTLGCYLIVKNEEKNINKCLDNLSRVCDEIVVVDTGSSDMTVPKAMGYINVTLKHFKWVDDFSVARNYAMTNTKSDYIFSIDADEILTDELVEKLQSLKRNDFNGYTAFEMYIKLSEDKFYLGGRQIVKNDGTNYWRYKIHEKLYFDESNVCVLDGDGEWIVHTPDNPYGNYDAYQEIYYNDVNNGDVLHTSNYGHYFYYLFFTLKDHDDFLAKRYLFEYYNKEKILMLSEKQHVNLLKNDFISQDEFNVYSLINLYLDPEIVLEYVNKLSSNDIPKYVGLLWSYENKGNLDESEYLSLSYLSYQYGLFNDFIKLTIEAYEKFPLSSDIKYNMDFINNTLSRLKNYTFVINCLETTKHLPSVINYVSQYCNEVYVIKNENEKIDKISFKPFKKVTFINNGTEIPGTNKKIIFNAYEKYDRIELKNFMSNVVNNNDTKYGEIAIVD